VEERGVRDSNVPEKERSEGSFDRTYSGSKRVRDGFNPQKSTRGRVFRLGGDKIRVSVTGKTGAKTNTEPLPSSTSMWRVAQGRLPSQVSRKVFGATGSKGRTPGGSLPEVVGCLLNFSASFQKTLFKRAASSGARFLEALV